MLRLVGEPAAEVAVPTIAFGDKLACNRKASFPFSLFKTSLSLFASGDYPFIGEESCQLLHASGWRFAPANEQYTFEKATRAGFTESGKEKAVFLLPQFGHTLTTVFCSNLLL